MGLTRTHYAGKGALIQYQRPTSVVLRGLEGEGDTLEARLDINGQTVMLGKQQTYALQGEDTLKVLTIKGTGSGMPRVRIDYEVGRDIRISQI